MTMLSVIIPVRNGEATIAQTLWSVLRQSRRPDEIIVLDDGSTDRSAEVARAVSPLVTVIEGPFGNASAARAIGADRARGEALMFLDADDLLGPGTLAALEETLQADPQAIATCAWKRFELRDGLWLAGPASCVPRRASQDDLSAWLNGWYHPPCALLWSRAAYEASGGWDPDIIVNQDGDVVMRALAEGVALRQADGGMAYYRRAPGGNTVSSRRGTIEGLYSQIAVLKKLEKRLQEQNRLAHYTRDLRTAFERIEKDAREHQRAVRKLNRATAAPEAADLCEALREAPDALAEGIPARPLVSVIIPAYNRSELLRRALQGVVTQTYDNIEILVVDDGSQEDLKVIVAGFEDDRIIYLRQPANAGTSAARNLGLAHSRGALIAFLDSDDEWLPEKLERQVELFAGAPRSVGLVYSSVLEENGAGERIPHIADAHGDVWREMMWRNVVHFGASSTLIKREVAATVGGFDESMAALEDYDYWVRVARFFEFEVVRSPLTIYHNGESAALAPTRRSRKFATNTAARRAFLQRYAWEADEAGVLHDALLEAARRQLESPEGNGVRGGYLVAKAIRARSDEPRLFAWLAMSLLPRPVRLKLLPDLKRVRTQLPSEAWFGAEGAVRRSGGGSGATPEQPAAKQPDH